MDNKVQASFIPRKPLTGSGLSRTASISFFTLLTVLLLIVTVTLSTGVFLYKKYLVAHTNSLKEKLENAKKEFDPTLVAQYERLDKRLKSAKTIIDGHVALTPVFELLETVTLPRVQFTDFQYGLEGKRAKITMKGKAQNFATVALQAEEFNKHSSQVQEPLFSELNVDEQGDVVFQFSAYLEPTLISYRRNLIVEPEAETVSTSTLNMDPTGNEFGTSTQSTSGTTTTGI